MQMPKEIGFFVSFVTLCGGAVLAMTGDLLIGACVAVAGVLGSLIFGEGPSTDR
jgi:hypothetical protein